MIDIDFENVINKIQKLCQLHPKQIFKNALHALLPVHLVEQLALHFSLPIDKKNGTISKHDVLNTVTLLKKVPLHAIGRGAGDEFVTAGGVKLSEINPKTMESIICPGLYFAGEILDIDGFTGGFNLQAAWATGRRAGLALAENSSTK